MIIHKFSKNKSPNVEISGGGFQFLSILFNYSTKNLWVKKNVVLLNSHHYTYRELLGYIVTKKKIYLRVDGPMYYHGVKRIKDEIKIIITSIFCKGIIYQSNWSYKKMSPFILNSNFSIIPNCASSMFVSKIPYESRVGFVFISNSDNNNKGYDLISLIEKKLDIKITIFGRYNGKDSRIPREQLSLELNKFKYYLALSENECCSNALIEAISCGCIPIVLKSGSHPELVENPYIDLTFSSITELTSIYQRLEVLDMNTYTALISLLHNRFKLNIIMSKYYEFLE